MNGTSANEQSRERRNITSCNPTPLARWISADAVVAKVPPAKDRSVSPKSQRARTRRSDAHNVIQPVHPERHERRAIINAYVNQELTKSPNPDAAVLPKRDRSIF